MRGDASQLGVASEGGMNSHRTFEAEASEASPAAAGSAFSSFVGGAGPDRPAPGGASAAASSARTYRRCPSWFCDSQRSRGSSYTSVI